MSPDKLHRLAIAEGERLMREYHSFGHRVTAAVNNNGGKPMVQLFIHRPTKVIPAMEFRSNGIKVHIHISR